MRSAHIPNKFSVFNLMAQSIPFFSPVWCSTHIFLLILQRVFPNGCCFLHYKRELAKFSFPDVRLLSNPTLKFDNLTINISSQNLRSHTMLVYIFCFLLMMYKIFRAKGLIPGQIILIITLQSLCNSIVV